MKLSSKTKWHDHMKRMARERVILNEKEECIKRNVTAGEDCGKEIESREVQKET